MKQREGIRVRAATAIAVPAAFALPAVERILKEFGEHPASTSPALNIHELHASFESLIFKPLKACVSPGCGRNEWLLKILIAGTAEEQLLFEGALRLLPAAASGSELELQGIYDGPSGASAWAQSSSLRFVREVAHRVAALSRWAEFA